MFENVLTLDVSERPGWTYTINKVSVRPRGWWTRLVWWTLSMEVSADWYESAASGPGDSDAAQ